MEVVCFCVLMDGNNDQTREEVFYPTKNSFEELVKIKVDHDMKKVTIERAEEHIKANLEEYLEKGIAK